MLSCFNNIIGLSATTCNCFIDGNEPADYNVSNSGLFLDELPGFDLFSVDQLEDCSKGNLWERLDKARNAAYLKIQNDLLGCITRKYIKTRQEYKGTIGQVKFKNTRQITDTYAGVCIDFGNIKGGKIIINSINTVMDTTGTFNIEVFKCEDLESGNLTPINTISVNSTSNAVEKNVLPTPLELAAGSDQCDTVRYFFLYQPAGFSPKDNDNSCGCGYEKKWKSWLQFGGVTTSDLAEVCDKGATTKTNGIQLDVELNCDFSGVICDGDLDFNNDPKAMTLAYAIRLLTAEILITDVINSKEINRYTLLDKKDLSSRRTDFNKQYTDLVNYLCDTSEDTLNDCFSCKSGQSKSWIRK